MNSNLARGARDRTRSDPHPPGRRRGDRPGAARPQACRARHRTGRAGAALRPDHRHRRAAGRGGPACAQPQPRVQPLRTRRRGRHRRHPHAMRGHARHVHGHPPRRRLHRNTQLHRSILVVGLGWAARRAEPGHCRQADSAHRVAGALHRAQRRGDGQQPLGRQQGRRPANHSRQEPGRHRQERRDEPRQCVRVRAAGHRQRPGLHGHARL